MFPHRIDVHHHAIPSAYLNAMDDAGVSEPIAGIDYPSWNVDTDLDVMDRNGIQAAIASITAPGVGFTSGANAARVARQVNEFLAQLIADHPTRYGAFAVIPLPDVDAALAEIDYALTSLELDGIGLFTHYRGVYLGDPEFEPVFCALADHDAVTFVHPTIPPATDQPGFDLPPSLYEFPFETTRMLVNLLYSGTLDRHPHLRLIAPHAGGVIPYLAQRLTYAATITPSTESRRPKNLIQSLRNLYYDTAMSANPYTLAGLASFVDRDRILFGTDYPFMPESTTEETVAGVTDFFDEKDTASIERDNALALFAHLAERIGRAADSVT